METKGWTAAFLGKCNLSRKHRPAIYATASDGDLKYCACRYQTSFVSQINPKASSIK